MSTKYGVLVFGNIGVLTKIQIASSLSASYVREGFVIGGSAPNLNAYNQYNLANKLVSPMIAWGNNPSPFPTDIPLYESKLTSFINRLAYNPSIVVIENEELNTNYHTNDISYYIAELTAAIPIIHAKGYEITNGGLLRNALSYVIYQYFLNEVGDPVKAAYWRTNTFSAKMNADYNSGAANALITACNTCISAYGTLDLDYVNVHWYESYTGSDYPCIGSEPGKYAIQDVAEYLVLKTGKPVITNETGQFSTSATLVTSMLQTFKDSGYEMVIWFDGEVDNEGYDTKALNNQTSPYALRDNGIAFKNFITQGMSFSPNFAASQTIGVPTNVNLEDTSTGSDVAITQRRVYFTNAAGDYVVQAGTTTDYETWSYSSFTASFNILTEDTALYILVQWLNVSNAVLYSLTQLVDFTMNNETELYTLAANEAAQLQLLQDTDYVMNTLKLRLLVDNANTSVNYNNIKSSQTNLNQATSLTNNQNSYF